LNGCDKELLKHCRGDKYGPWGWEVQSISGNHINTPSDCLILCWECYKQTL